jgi:hypothetical protein
MAIDHRVEALHLYCRWLNIWTESEMPDAHIYTPEQFTTYAPERGLYGNTSLETVIPLDELRVLRIMEVNDGDEGGPATLLTIWDDDEIIQMTQHFDGRPQEIYNLEHEGFARVP